MKDAKSSLSGQPCHSPLPWSSCKHAVHQGFFQPFPPLHVRGVPFPFNLFFLKHKYMGRFNQVRLIWIGNGSKDLVKNPLEWHFCNQVHNDNYAWRSEGFKVGRSICLFVRRSHATVAAPRDHAVPSVMAISAKRLLDVLCVSEQFSLRVAS